MDDETVMREKKILGLIEQEIEDGTAMATAVRHMAAELLVNEKGFGPEDIRSPVLFEVRLDEEVVQSTVDFLVSVDGIDAMIVKCAAGALNSRERQVLAAARVCCESPVPLAVVMDPMSAVVLDSANGKTLGEGYDAIPDKQQLRDILSRSERKQLSPEKREREKRVLLAFDAIQCCVPKGADGGVSLDADSAK
jgi:hypothetical protein